MRVGPDTRAFPADEASLAILGTGCTLAATLGGGLAGVQASMDPAVVMAVLAMLAGTRGSGPLTPSTRCVLCLAGLTTLAPDGRLAMLGLTSAALAILFTRACDNARPLATLWLATAWHVLWAKAAFKLVSDTVIGFETPLVAAVGRLAFPALSVDGTRIVNGGWYIHVVEGCSAFHGLSLAALAWLAAARLYGARMDARMWCGLVAACLGVIALNVGRIVAMLPSESAYSFWHDGPGGIAAVGMTATLGTIPVILLARAA